jgi:hypothetical protein
VTSVTVPTGPQDVTGDHTDQRVFVFWESPAGQEVPGYISLCLETLRKTNPDKHIFLLNRGNSRALLGDDIDWAAFARLPLAMQSDVLKAHILFKFGGIFTDADMIYTGEVGWLTPDNRETLCGFGKPGKDMHMSLLAIGEPGSPLLWHVAEMQRYRLAHPPRGKLPWDHMGNSILDPMVRALYGQGGILTVPNREFLLEMWFGYQEQHGLKYGSKLYQSFYFGADNMLSADEMLQIPKHHVVFLHNSWTPPEIKAMRAAEFIKQDFAMARIFRHVLGVAEVDEDALIRIPLGEAAEPGRSLGFARVRGLSTPMAAAAKKLATSAKRLTSALPKSLR